MGRVWQEFYCGECPADEPRSKDPAKAATGGYFMVTLNMGLNLHVRIVCPRCKHEHVRVIRDGEIFEDGRDEKLAKENIRPRLSSWSRTPRTRAMIEGEIWSQRRKGAVINSPEAIREGEEFSDYRRAFLRESWLRIAGREQGEGD